jgi:D-alanine-D-alanine ligase
MIVAVLSGGRSSEHEVSLASGEAVRAGLAQAGHEVLDVRIARDGTWSHDGAPVTLEPGRGLLGAGCAFPVLHGPFGEDGTLQGLLEILDVPYVGAGVLASALCMDKVLFKDVMAQAGVPQVRYAALHDGGPGTRPRGSPPVGGPGPSGASGGVEQTDLDGLGMPLFVKPARLGSSVGIAKVVRAIDLGDALREAFTHDPLVIAEAMSNGIEVECSVLGNDDPEASEPGEITFASDWYDYEAKYTPGGMELVVPARISDAARARVQELAVETFLRVGCSGLARVDFFVEGDDVLVNELNTMPGFTPTSVYAKLWDASGLPYPELCDRLCSLAVERHERERKYSY